MELLDLQSSCSQIFSRLHQVFPYLSPQEMAELDIFWPKNLSKVSSIRRGRRQETISRPIYCRKKQKNRKQIIVYDTGLVVNSSFPHLEASSDSKV
ncbi:unnamed protein product [Pocillopora meandrina]|uniref:Uncharacterized protein n=1 Tax=Pocillopora meandrina TaxID=46732 RepID=A0AAU9VNE1_9CNID|nr:unnamed protein product [Pocillopora meandrina]